MSNILDRLLPAFAEARRPLQIGYIWLFIGWLVAPDLASNIEYNGIAALRAIRLFEALSTSLQFATVSAAAFFVGSLANYISDTLGRVHRTRLITVASHRWRLPIQYDLENPRFVLSKAKKELIPAVLALFIILEVKIVRQPFGLDWPSFVRNIPIQALLSFSPILLLLPTLLYFESRSLREKARLIPEGGNRDNLITSRLGKAIELLTSGSEVSQGAALQELGDLAQEVAESPDTIQSRRDSTTLATVLTSFISTAQDNSRRTKQSAITALGFGKRQRPFQTRRLSLKNSNFNSLSFQGGDYSFIDFTSSRFECSILGAALFKASIFRDADLRGAELIEANFNAAEMQGANLTNTELIDSAFRSADLSGAVLKNANVSTKPAVLFVRWLRDQSHYAYYVRPGERTAKMSLRERRIFVGFKEAKLNGADCAWLTAKNTNFGGVKARNCDFSNAIMPNTSFHDADLQNSTFHGADLRHANFGSADLRGADMRGAKLAGAVFHRAKLSGAQLDFPLTGEQQSLAAYMRLMKNRRRNSYDVE